MSNNLKIFLGVSYLLILFAFLYFIFTSIQIDRLGDFSYYKELQSSLSIYIGNNISINLIYYFIFERFVIVDTLAGHPYPIINLFFSFIFFNFKLKSNE